MCNMPKFQKAEARTGKQMFRTEKEDSLSIDLQVLVVDTMNVIM